MSASLLLASFEPGMTVRLSPKGLGNIKLPNIGQWRGTVALSLPNAAGDIYLEERLPPEWIVKLYSPRQLVRDPQLRFRLHHTFLRIT